MDNLVKFFIGEINAEQMAKIILEAEKVRDVKLTDKQVKDIVPRFKCFISTGIINNGYVQYDEPERKLQISPEVVLEHVHAIRKLKSQNDLLQHIAGGLAEAEEHDLSVEVITEALCHAYAMGVRNDSEDLTELDEVVKDSINVGLASWDI